MQKSVLSALCPAAGAGSEARGAHHVEHARGEAEQQEHDQPPRRDVKPAIEQPAHQSSKEHARDTLGRGAGSVSFARLAPVRSSRSPRRLSLAERAASSVDREPGCWSREPMIATPASAGNSRYFSHPQSRADHTDGVPPCQESAPVLQIPDVVSELRDPVMFGGALRSRRGGIAITLNASLPTVTSSREPPCPAPSIIISRCFHPGPISAMRSSWTSCAAIMSR